MIVEKKITLKPILESNQGVHLTAYLVNRKNLKDLKSQLRNVIEETYEWINNVMSIEDSKKFMQPIESLLKETRIFKEIKGHIGIFRNETSFRVINIPISIEQSCQVATSFHVKPLLRWLQGDEDFLFLGIEKDTAHLYFGSQNSFNKVDSVLIPETFKLKYNMEKQTHLKRLSQNKSLGREIASFLEDWISKLTKHSKPKLFVAGEPLFVQSLYKNMKYINIVKTPVAESFSRHNPNEACAHIRMILKDDARKFIEKSLLEFRYADTNNLVKKNIFQISKAVVQGKVRKLIVTSDISIFGKIDPITGGLAIHPFDLDHEDDCILDDLAQMVLLKGGEVVIAKKNEIPHGRPVLAILDDESPSYEKTKILQYKALEERFG